MRPAASWSMGAVGFTGAVGCGGAVGYIGAIVSEVLGVSGVHILVVSCLLHCLWIQLGPSYGVFQVGQSTTPQRGLGLRLSMLTGWMLIKPWRGDEVGDGSNWDLLQVTR